MSDGALAAAYPYDPQFLCDRCDRAIDKHDDGEVLELLVFPSVEAAARMRDATRSVTLCRDCQQRLVEPLEALALTEIGVTDERSDVPAWCSRCGTPGSATDEVVAGGRCAVVDNRWAGRLCRRCAAWFRRTLDRQLGERTPYDPGMYYSPDLRRAEAGVAAWAAAVTGSVDEAVTGSVDEAVTTLQEGDLLRLVAYRAGGMDRGQYLRLTGRVDRTLAPLADGPPALIEITTAELELAVPTTPRTDRWRIEADTTPPTIGYAERDLGLVELSILSRGTGTHRHPTARE